MSFWERLKDKLGGDSEELSTAYHIVDMAGLSAGGRPSPRDRVILLQKLAQFAEREQLRMCVVMEGRALREAPDGEVFKSIHVYYAESSEQLSDRIQQLARSNSKAMVVTHRRDLEAWANQNGVETLRTSSLRRGLDESSGGGRGGDSGRANGQRGRNRRPQRTRRSSSGGGGGGDRSQSPPKEPKPQPTQNKEPPRQDGVSDLIDLV